MQKPNQTAGSSQFQMNAALAPRPSGAGRRTVVLKEKKTRTVGTVDTVGKVGKVGKLQVFAV